MCTLNKSHTRIKANRNIQLHKSSNLTSHKTQSASIGRLCTGIIAVYFKSNVKCINKVRELQTEGNCNN